MKESKYVFEYYRYQLVPKKIIQLTIDNESLTVEQLKAKKNEFFSKILNALKLKNSVDSSSKTSDVVNVSIMSNTIKKVLKNISNYVNIQKTRTVS